MLTDSVPFDAATLSNVTIHPPQDNPVYFVPAAQQVRKLFAVQQHLHLPKNMRMLTNKYRPVAQVYEKFRMAMLRDVQVFAVSSDESWLPKGDKYMRTLDRCEYFVVAGLKSVDGYLMVAEPAVTQISLPFMPSLQGNLSETEKMVLVSVAASN